jgi:hypothetical protein
MKTYGDRIKELEAFTKALKSEIKSLRNQLQTYKKPHSVNQAGKPNLIAGAANIGRDKALLAWNDEELINTDISEKGDDPTVGINKHTHSRYSGGALNIEAFELVEYDIDWDSSEEYHKHNMGLWTGEPSIATAQNSNGENVDKIGPLDVEFNPDTGKYGATAMYIDIEKTYLVKRDSDGNIETDANGIEMKAPLYNSDATKNAIVWDANARVFRFYATFSNWISEVGE